MRIASRVLTCSRTLASWRRLREDDRPVRAVPCALAAQTRGGVDSRDERRTLASEVLRMSRALREVLRMSCEAVNATNNGASGGKGRTIPLYFSTKRRRAILDASAYGKHGHSLRETHISHIPAAKLPFSHRLKCLGGEA